MRACPRDGSPSTSKTYTTVIRCVASGRGSSGSVARFLASATYLHDDGVPEYGAEAAKWLRPAAAHGSPIAYLDLAQLDGGGVDGRPDHYEAYIGSSIALAWLRDTGAPSFQIELVPKRRDSVAAKLTLAQTDKAYRFISGHMIVVRR